ncbi:MAG: ATP-dependent Clp protease ATP-binding subunit [bacterium]|nr:ATP-dependent Clp protease ATP-binding subunit [bacterium]
MIFEIKQTKIYQAVRWAKCPLFGYQKTITAFFLLVGLFLLSLVAFKSQNAGLRQAEMNLLWACAGFYFLCLIWFFELKLFFNNCLLKPKFKTLLSEAIKDPQRYNLAEFCDFKTAQVINKALGQNKRNTLIPFESHLLLCLLKEKAEVLDFVFYRGQLDRGALKELLKQNPPQASAETQATWQGVILTALHTSNKSERQTVSLGDLLFALSNELPLFKQFLIERDFTSNDILNLVNWHWQIKEKQVLAKKWWLRENLSQRGSVARDWVSTYTLNLDRFGNDLRERIKKNSFREIVGHNQEALLAERVLSKEIQCNLLLVGEPGVGKFSVVEKIAQRAYAGKSTPALNYKRIIDLDLSSLVSAASETSQAEALFDLCFKEALNAGNVVLCLKNIDSFVSEDSSLGALNITALLSKYLNYPNFQVIALTSYAGLHNVLEQKSAFLSQFEKVEVKEVSIDETLLVLEDFTWFFEAKYKRSVSYRALKEILKLSNRYLSQIPLPGKATRLFDESMAYLSLHTKDQCLTVNHVKKIVSEKTQMPLEDLEEKEKTLLLQLEKEIHKDLIDQEEAVKEVADALRRTRTQVNQKQGIIGGFLFLGPTGVGKTELAKILTKIYFQSEKKMLRFDMSEFQTANDLKRLIGEGKNAGSLSVQIREEPFCLLLLDEIEKASKDILNLFLQILDEGFFTDSMGRRVDFSNAIIIATSNAGSMLIRERVKQERKPEEIKQELIDYLIKENIYRPEFLNRFDAIVFFKPLGKKELLQIAQLMLAKLAQSLYDKGMIFEITLPLKEKIVELAYNPEFGAREMKRVIQNKIENVLSVALLNGTLKRGQRITLEPNSFVIVKINDETRMTNDE